MNYYVVPITGDPDRAMGLLAKAGIQSLGSQSFLIGSDGGASRGPFPTVSARLAATDAESATDRVRAALPDEDFTVEDARPE
jgi:hypothetical protein